MSTTNMLRPIKTGKNAQLNYRIIACYLIFFSDNSRVVIHLLQLIHHICVDNVQPPLLQLILQTVHKPLTIKKMKWKVGLY